MRSRPTSFALAALACLLGAAAGPAEARAQSITLSPAVIPLAGSAGQSVTQVLTLQNDSDLPLAFEMEARDVVVRDGARVFVEAGVLADSIAASAVFTPRELRLGPRSRATVTVTLTLPAGVRHRAAVALFRGTTPVPSGDRQALLSLGSLFTFTLSDRVSIAAGALEAEPPSASANARLGSTLVNDGAEPVVPAGMAVILDAGGRLVGKAPFAARRLLPGERTTLVADYPGDLGAGTYRAVATFDYAGRALTLTGSLVVP
jgi:hypothetical protein